MEASSTQTNPNYQQITVDVPEDYLGVVTQLLAFDHGRLGSEAYWRVPTLFWFGASDGALHAACYAGVALSAAALLG